MRVYQNVHYICLSLVSIPWMPSASSPSLSSESTNTCGFYLAPSTTSPDVLGLYTAKDIPQYLDQQQQHRNYMPSGGPPDISIQFVDPDEIYDNDYSEQEGEEGEFESQTYSILNNSYLEELIWTPSITGGSFESKIPDAIVTLIPGLGMMSAFNPTLKNVIWNDNATLRRLSSSKLGSNKGPGAGAYSYYYNATAIPSRKIFAGEELFIDFGNEWESSAEDDDEYGNKNIGDRSSARAADSSSSSDYDDYEDDYEDDYYYESADERRRKLEIELYKSTDKKIHAIKAYFDKYEDEIQNPDSKTKIYQYLYSTIVDRKIRNLIPRDVNELETIHKYGSLVYKHKKQIKSLEWLESNGQCVDHLTAKPSTLPHAGRGAFTTRPISKGTIIVTTPLAPIIDPSMLEMPFIHHTVTSEFKSSAVKNKFQKTYQNKQILLNYCYGHPQSSLLLFPYGNIVNFINHDSNEPNAQIQWSESFPLFQPSLRNKPIETLQSIRKPMLFFDIVATRDLQEDEEVFLDYGTEWEMAWDTHVHEWNSSKYDHDNHDEKYVSHLYMNEEMRRDKSLIYYTLDEQQDQHSYPENIMTTCFTSEALLTFKADRTTIDWSFIGNDFDGDCLRACDILDRYVKGHTDGNNNDNYETKSELRDEKNSGKETLTTIQEFVYKVKVKNIQDKPLILNNVPREAIMFMEKPGYGDVYLPTAFRHFIGLEEGLFPEAWMDKKRND